MSEEAHNHHTPELADVGHRARRYVIPSILIATALTVLHEMGLALTIGAVVTWLLTLFFTFTSAMHDWKACSYCTTAPRRWDTEEKRERIARRLHHGGRRFLIRVAVTILLVHALLPKPYMDPWWAQAIAGGYYFLIGVLLTQDMISLSHHTHQYQSECPVEWCRAGLKRNPETTRRHRRQMWSGHNGAWLIAVLAPTACTLGVLSMEHPHAVLRVAYGGLVLLLVTVALDVTALHANEPCLRCFKHLPDKPVEAAEKRMRWLRLFHRTSRLALSLAIGTMILSWMLAGMLAAKFLVCSAGLAILYWAVLNRVHSPVKPWCPWCKDDGGEEADADVPDPVTNVPSPA